jgi:hypothetical protein
MSVINVHDAKTNFSKLPDRADAFFEPLPDDEIGAWER